MTEEEADLIQTKQLQEKEESKEEQIKTGGQQDVIDEMKKLTDQK